MQDRASSGVRKLEEAGGDSAWRDVFVEIMCGLIGENASMVDARAIKMARLEEDALILMVMVEDNTMLLLILLPGSADC